MISHALLSAKLNTQTREAAFGVHYLAELIVDCFLNRANRDALRVLKGADATSTAIWMNGKKAVIFSTVGDGVAWAYQLTSVAAYAFIRNDVFLHVLPLFGCQDPLLRPV